MTASGTPTFTLHLQPDVQAIAYARLVMRRSLPELDETTDALFYGAVTEIISNAITAQNAADPSATIAVGVQTSHPQAIAVTDTGSGFDPDGLRVGSSTGGIGFGLQIARSVCPDMGIDSSGAGTTVTMPYPEPLFPSP